MSQLNDRPENGTLSRRRFLVFSAGLAALAACSPPQSGTGSAVALLQYGEAGAFSTFNPWAQVLNQLSTANQVFSRLVYKTGDGEPVADLAESWEVAADGRSIQLTLRSGVVWHDGKDLVADDFVQMFDYLSDAALESDPGVQKVKELFTPVNAVTAPDPLTVDMKFSAPVPYILDLLNYWYAVRFDDPKDVSFVRHLPMGTGPLRMTDFVQSQNASFEAFDDYYVDGQPKIEAWRFSIFAEGSNLVPNLTSGQVQGILVNNYADVDSLLNDSAYRVEAVRLGVWPLMVNVSKPPFDDVAVRQALAHSMNRQAFAEAAHFGLEDPVASPFFTDAATGYVAELVDAYPFDLDMARSLLDDAGVDTLTMTYPAPSSFPNLGVYGQIWQQDLAEIGVTLEVQTVSPGRWSELGAGEDSDADVVPWQVGRCLQDGAVFFAANSGYRGADQRFGYTNATLEDLVARGRTEIDPAVRAGIYQQLNQIVVDECTNISMCTYSSTFAWSSTVTGPEYDLAGNLGLADAEVEA